LCARSQREPRRSYLALPMLAEVRRAAGTTCAQPLWRRLGAVAKLLELELVACSAALDDVRWR